MLLSFSIKEFPELFTVTDYKYVLKNVKQHFLDECKIQRVDVLYAKTFYNPETNEGIVDYNFIDFEGRAYLPQMDLPLSNDYITIIFE